MKVVVIACAGGATSSLLCTKVKKAAEANGVSCEYEVAFLLGNREEMKKMEDRGVELLILYGGAALFTDNKFSREQLSIVELAMIAPQMKHMLVNIKPVCDELDIPLEAIPMQDFGMMRGEKIFNQINTMIELGV